jgi:lysozyme
MKIIPKVIDIYRLNEVSNLHDAVDDGIRGVIHKASEGAAQPAREVPRYNERRQIAADIGLLWGAYHFIRPGKILDQAHRFVDLAEPGVNTLLALDHEDPRVPLRDAVAFLQEVHRETGRMPKLYSGHVLKEQLARVGADVVEFLKGVPLWLAQYGAAPSWPATVWRAPWLWQFTGDGQGPLPHHVAGVDGVCDISSYAGTDEQLTAEWAGC